MPDQAEKRQVLVEWDNPLPDIAAAMQMSGLAYMQAIAAGQMTAAPIARVLDYTIADVREGYASFRGTPTERHLNPLGTVHGGFAMTLLDSALGCAVHTTLPPGMGYGTAQFNIHLTRAITVEVGELLAEGRVVHRGSRIATAEGTLKDAKGKLYAHATATCFLLAATPEER